MVKKISDRSIEFNGKRHLNSNQPLQDLDFYFNPQTQLVEIYSTDTPSNNFTKLLPELFLSDYNGEFPGVHEICKYYFPEITDEQIDYIMWEETCFPFSSDVEILFAQIYDYFDQNGFEEIKEIC